MSPAYPKSLDLARSARSIVLLRIPRLHQLVAGHGLSKLGYRRRMRPWFQLQFLFDRMGKAAGPTSARISCYDRLNRLLTDQRRVTSDIVYAMLVSPMELRHRTDSNPPKRVASCINCPTVVIFPTSPKSWCRITASATLSACSLGAP